MESTQQIKQFTNEKVSKQAKAEDLFKELLEIVRNSFIGTYEAEDHSIIMRIPNGAKIPYFGGRSKVKCINNVKNLLI